MARLKARPRPTTTGRYAECYQALRHQSLAMLPVPIDAAAFLRNRLVNCLCERTFAPRLNCTPLRVRLIRHYKQWCQDRPRLDLHSRSAGPHGLAAARLHGVATARQLAELLRASPVPSRPVKRDGRSSGMDDQAGRAVAVGEGAWVLPKRTTLNRPGPYPTAPFGIRIVWVYNRGYDKNAATRARAQQQGRCVAARTAGT